MFRDIKINVIIVAGFLVSGLIPLMIAMLLSYFNAGSELKEHAFKHLESVRDIKKNHLEFLARSDENLSQKVINYIMSERSGMGESGETYLVNSSYKMASDSYLDPKNRSVVASRKGTVSDNGADTKAVRQALKGVTGRDIIDDYRGIPVLSVFAPVKIRNDVLAIVAEMDEKEIDDRISKALNRYMIWLLIMSVVLLGLLAFLVSAVINKGIQDVITELEELVSSVLKGESSRRTDPGRIGRDFHDVAQKINQLVDSFETVNAEKQKLTEDRNYNQRLEAIGTLAGGIAHDFNNILSYMFTYSDLIQGKLEEGSQEHEYMLEMDTAIERAADLVGQIMTFSKQNKKEKKPLKMALIVKETAKLLTATLPKNISVKKDISKDDIYVLADPAVIHQIVMNICTNAYHSMMNNGGEMRIDLKKVEGNRCCFKVSDTGEGMTEEVRQRIFEPFFTTKPQGLGHGMGLSVVHGIVEQLGGEINVESETKKGTVISVFLPLISGHGSANPKVQINQAKGGDQRILFIDDEKKICASNKIMLEELGYSVTTLCEKKLTVENIPDPNNFDIVITDINMKGISGIGLLEKIKEQSKVPVLLITGYSETITPEKAIEFGASGLLFKPFKKQELIDEISRITK